MGSAIFFMYHLRKTCPSSHNKKQKFSFALSVCWS